MRGEVTENEIIGRLALLCHPSLARAFPDMGPEEMGGNCKTLIETGLCRIDEWVCLECNAKLIKFVFLAHEDSEQTCPECGSGAFEYVPPRGG